MHKKIVKHPYHRRKQTGLTLIELMMAMVLGLAVTAAATQGFITHIGTQKFTEEINRMNERGRFSIVLRGLR